MKSREYRWNLKYEDRTLNIYCKINGDEAVISFNFHLVVQDTMAAAAGVAGKIIPFREKTKSVIRNVFELALEG